LLENVGRIDASGGRRANKLRPDASRVIRDMLVPNLIVVCLTYGLNDKMRDDINPVAHGTVHK
jgi:hypothetical protein